MRLEQISWFQAPPRSITPRVIPIGYQLVEVIIGGEVLFPAEGADSYRTCGSIFWHIPGERTVFRSNQKNPYSCITFLFSGENAGLRSVPRYAFWDEPSEVVHFCRNCLGMFTTDDISLATLGDYCYSLLRWKAYLYSKQIRELQQPSLLTSVTTYLEKAELSEITVESMAETAGISVPYLHQLFTKHRGIPAYRHVLELKMRKAKLLLASTSDQVKTIGLSCGFGSPESFSRSFKQHTGMTPGEYRQKRGPYYRLQ